MYQLRKIAVGSIFVTLGILIDMFGFGISGAGIALLGMAIVINV